MAKKELIPPEKWEGLKAALEDAGGGKKSTPRRKATHPGKPGNVPANASRKGAPKPADEKKKVKKKSKKKDEKDKKKKDKKDKKKKKKKEKKKRKTGKTRASRK